MEVIRANGDMGVIYGMAGGTKDVLLKDFL
jgi:hypothetical protein